MTQTQRPPTLIPSVIAPAMQTGVPTSQSFTARLWRGFTTLRGRFTTLLIVILVITCLTALAVSLSSSRAYTDLNTISSKSIPSTTAAQSIVPYLEDIDAHAADYLASANNTSFAPCTNSLTGQQLGQISIHACADKTIDADLLGLNHQLFLASQNAAYPGFETALEQTQTGLQTYVADINLMRHEYSLAAPGNPNDPHLQQAYQALHDAQTTLLQRLPGRVTNAASLPACTLNGQGTLDGQTWPNQGIETNMLCLSSLGKQQEDSAYQDTVSFFGISLGIVFGLSIYCCIFLLWVTWSMTTITRKIFNLGLLVALLLGLYSTTVVLADFDAIYGHNGYFSVVDTAYNNVYSAGTLQQESTQVQADQARWLVALSFHDQGNANQWQSAQQNKSQEVTRTLQTLSTQVQSAQEKALLTRMQQDWQQYTAQVNTVAQQTSNPVAAEALHASTTTATFQSFLQDVQHFSNLDTQSYQTVLSAAGNRLSQLTTLWALIFPVLGVIGAWGISRRLKDF